MFRVLQSISGKNCDASFKAGEDMKRGMGVIKNSDEVEFPASATCKDVFFVTRDSIASGAYAGLELPDYDDVYENIKDGEYVTIIKPIIGEKYFTNQCDTVADGDYLVVGVDGKIEKAGVSTKSNLVVIDADYSDAGHTGVCFECCDWITTPAS